MSELTDERLDLERLLSGLEEGARRVSLSERYRTVRVKPAVIDQLVKLIRAERAAHQATRAELQQMEWHMANIVAQAGYRRLSCQRCAFAYTTGRKALGKDTERAGQEGSDV